MFGWCDLPAGLAYFEPRSRRDETRRKRKPSVSGKRRERKRSPPRPCDRARGRRSGEHGRQRLRAQPGLASPPWTGPPNLQAYHVARSFTPHTVQVQTCRARFFSFPRFFTKQLSWPSSQLLLQPASKQPLRSTVPSLGRVWILLAFEHAFSKRKSHIY